MQTEKIKQAIDCIDCDRLVNAKDILILAYQEQQQEQQVEDYIEGLI